jgi:hypothetical protein
MSDLRKFTPKPPLWRRIRENFPFVPDSYWSALWGSFIAGMSVLAVGLVFHTLGWNVVLGTTLLLVIVLVVKIVRYVMRDWPDVR